MLLVLLLMIYAPAVRSQPYGSLPGSACTIWSLIQERLQMQADSSTWIPFALSVKDDISVYTVNARQYTAQHKLMGYQFHIAHHCDWRGCESTDREWDSGSVAGTVRMQQLQDSFMTQTKKLSYIMTTAAYMHRITTPGNKQYIGKEMINTYNKAYWSGKKDSNQTQFVNFNSEAYFVPLTRHIDDQEWSCFDKGGQQFRDREWRSCPFIDTNSVIYIAQALRDAHARVARYTSCHITGRPAFIDSFLAARMNYIYDHMRYDQFLLEDMILLRNKGLKGKQLYLFTDGTALNSPDGKMKNDARSMLVCDVKNGIVYVLHKTKRRRSVSISIQVVAYGIPDYIKNELNWRERYQPYCSHWVKEKIRYRWRLRLSGNSFKAMMPTPVQGPIPLAVLLSFLDMPEETHED